MNIKKLEIIEEQKAVLGPIGANMCLQADKTGILAFAEKHWKQHETRALGPWNGRQIHNAFINAVRLARDDRVDANGEGQIAVLTERHFQIITHSVTEIDKYMALVGTNRNGAGTGVLPTPTRGAILYPPAESMHLEPCFGYPYQRREEWGFEVQVNASSWGGYRYTRQIANYGAGSAAVPRATGWPQPQPVQVGIPPRGAERLPVFSSSRPTAISPDEAAVHRREGREADRIERREADRRKREEANRREQDEADRRERDEADRRERPEADYCERDKADGRRRFEADRLKRGEAHRRERLEADRRERPEADRRERREALQRERYEAFRHHDTKLSATTSATALPALG